MDRIIIVEENFKDIDPNLLLDPKRYPEVENMVVSISAAADFGYAREYVKLMADKLTVLAEKIPSDLAGKYLRLLKALRLFSIADVSDGEKEKFFREHVADSMLLEFVDVPYWIELVMKMYYPSSDLVEQERKIYLRGLESNVQLLGKEDLAAGHERKHPTVGNWLSDYRAFVNLAAAKTRRGALEELTYINQSPNVKKLGANERLVLQKLIKLYDWLSSERFQYDFSLPEQQPEEELMLPGDQHDLIPKDLADFVNTRIAARPRPAAVKLPLVPLPLHPQPFPVAPQKLADLIKPAPPKPIVPIKPIPPVPPPPPGLSIDRLKQEIAQQKQDHLARNTYHVTTPKLSPQEIRREVETKELPSHVEKPVLSVVQGKNSPQPPLYQRGGGTASGKAGELSHSATGEIKYLDDLKKIDVKYLRQGQLAAQISNLKTQISHLALANHLYPHEVIAVFEQSPLFRAYLAHGSAKVTGSGNAGDLSQAEFEAVADLKRELEKM